MSRFEKPDVTILKISNGDTLTVKRRLNAGETRHALSEMSIQSEDGELRVNRLKIGFATVLAYLVDWSVTDDTGALVEIRGKGHEHIASILDALETESYEEIRDAIQAHDVAARVESEKKKAARAGGNGSSAISTSPAPATGESSGSENSAPTITT